MESHTTESFVFAASINKTNLKHGRALFRSTLNELHELFWVINPIILA